MNVTKCLDYVSGLMPLLEDPYLMTINQFNSIQFNSIVPHELFRGNLNDHFIENYTHWLDPIKEVVYIRRIAFYDQDCDYKLTRKRLGSTEGWELYDELNHNYLMSINSEGFRLLTKALSRLELVRYIHVFANDCLEFTDSNVIGVHLSRHNLRFCANINGMLESLEYSGYQVSLNQDLAGTFVGLQNCLLLENGAKRMILVPHGRITMPNTAFGNIHHCSEILLESLSQPSFFVYEFDEVLKRIVAKKSISAWLYLAALHAVTSSTLPDPFTGMTGTEMAVNVLQSAQVWSCSPYEKESLQILKFIKQLTPIRNYHTCDMSYGNMDLSVVMRLFLDGQANYDRENVMDDNRKAIEWTQWPVGVPSMVAYDGYVFLVNNLIRDSVRLVNIHPIMDKCSVLYLELMKDCFSRRLLLRAYLRNLSKYNDHVRVQEKAGSPLELHVKESEQKMTLTTKQRDYKLACMMTASYISYLCDTNLPLARKCIYVAKDTLYPYLITKDAYFYTDTEGTIDLTLKNLLNTDFRKLWLKCYSLAIAEDFDNHKFSILLSAMAYGGVPIEQIAILQLVRILTKRKEDTFPPVPDFASNFLGDPTHLNFSVSEIAEILQEHSGRLKKPKMKASDVEEKAAFIAKEKRHNSEVAKNCRMIAERWSAFWPCKEISKNEIVVTSNGRRIIRNGLASMKSRGKITANALNKVNSKLREWYCAREFKCFIEKVQNKLNGHSHITSVLTLTQQSQFNPPVLQTVCTKVQCQSSKFHVIAISNLIDRNEMDSELVAEAAEIYRTGRLDVNWTDQNEDRIQELQSAHQVKIREIEGMILKSVLKSVNHRILHASGLIPRLSPVIMLKSLCVPTPDHNDNSYILKQCIGALAVLRTNLKQWNRCIHYELTGSQEDLERELQNPGHENWSPTEHPEWLLIELELDIMIRKVQVEVARQMMKMPDGKNGVMQLNMGEGKTSVIVPMLCSSLTTEDSLCRVTVLSSIFKMNWNILKFAIGGLLNRRLYSFPCRRDMKIDEKCVKDIRELYKECLELKGVVLTLPEYRLSFRLLAFDNILKGATALGLQLLQTENWLRWYARDILDESDELLNVKYQLVYTRGKEIPVDGGEVRWLMCQLILEFVQDIAFKLLETHGSTQIEINNEQKKKCPHEFAALRLLASTENEEFFHTFDRLLVNKFLAEVMLSEVQSKLVADFLLKKEISKESHAKVMNILNKDPALIGKVLTLVGYLRRGVLSVALSKRWRVEYGVDQKGFRKMAVPFRAKDVPAERTDFAHPDLAIILTHLSYYYSGLSDSELGDVFAKLKKTLGAEAIYSQWIDKIPPSMVDVSLKEFKCLHLNDAIERLKLFDLIRKHKMVVDYWLSHFVFPKESKQFPRKLVMTAADLVYERQRLPITGFSGTNDSIVLLPLTINQQDHLPQLNGTNEKTEQMLLQPENCGHRGLAMGVTCDEILKQLKEDNLRILIDSGALMLELDNENVARRWLQTNNCIEAAVYFNHCNELMVKSRWSAGSIEFIDVPFELSPFQGKLGSCGVFIDDQHTRGTDFKFPLGSKACVTIGSRMKREKLLQACMRMRQVGKGHAVSFYLSHEANDKVLSVTSTLSTSSILEWVKLNTQKFNEDNLINWVTAEISYAQRLAAEGIFHFPNWKDPIKATNLDFDKAYILASQCQDKEITALMDMYGQHSSLELMTDLIVKWFDCTKSRLIELNGLSPPRAILSRFDEIFKAVWLRCHANVPTKRMLSNAMSMEEQQEKEYELMREIEVEEERQVQRPPKVEPAKPKLHPNVKQMVVDGKPFKVMAGVMRLSDIFMNTSFAGEVQPGNWAVDNLFATNDFISVIKPRGKHDYSDLYSRPMEYFISKKKRSGTVQILFLSPYEANELLPYIRNSKNKCSLHMFATRRFFKQDMLLNSPRLQLPPAVNHPPTEKFHVVDSGSRDMAALLLASGSLYFNYHSEQNAFADFLSLKPKPWTEDSRRLFEAGMIMPSSFLVPEFRRKRKRNQVLRGFQKDPTELVMKILMCRHPVVSDGAHVVRLLDEKRFISFRDQGNDCEQDNAMEEDP